MQGARHWNYCRAKPIIDAHFATLTAAGVTMGTYTPVTTDGTVCPTAIPTGLAETGDYTVGGVTYTFANDVGASLQFSEAIAAIKELLTSGAAMSEVQTAYENYGLKGLADLPRAGETYGTFTGSTYGFGSTTWISDTMTKALASPNTWAPKYSARAEIIEKTLMDALAVQLILDDLEHATDTAHSHTDAEKRAFVDHAAAKFLGTAAARSSRLATASRAASCAAFTLFWPPGFVFAFVTPWPPLRPTPRASCQPASRPSRVRRGARCRPPRRCAA